MTKAELVKLLAEAGGMTATAANDCIEYLGDIMAAELLGGGEVPLPRIGKLYIKYTAARQGRNPQTGATLQIPAKKKLGVSMAKDFKVSLN